MRTRSYGFIALLTCMMCAVVPAAIAQIPDEFEDPRDNTGGIMIGAYIGVIPGFTVTGKDALEGVTAKLGTGASIGLQVGYSFLPWLAAFVNVDRSDHDSQSPLGEDGYSLHHIEIAARFLYHVPRREKIVAHGNVGFGVRQIYNKHARIDSLAGRLILTARELSAGGGVQYFFSPNFAFDGNIQFGFGHFNKATIPGLGSGSIKTENVVSTRLRAGIAWYPFDY